MAENAPASYHRAGRYSMSPGFKVTRIGLAKWESDVVFLVGLSGSQVARGTPSAASSKTNSSSPESWRTYVAGDSMASLTQACANGGKRTKCFCPMT